METINHSTSIVALLAILSIPSWSTANDGDFDVNNNFPAVGRIAAITTVSGRIDYVGAYCSGTLIAEDDAACTTDTQGALCVPTGTDNLFVGGTQLTGGGGAPTDADYWVGTANGSLSAEQVVSNLAELNTRHLLSP